MFQIWASSFQMYFRLVNMHDMHRLMQAVRRESDILQQKNEITLPNAEAQSFAAPLKLCQCFVIITLSDKLTQFLKSHI